MKFNYRIGFWILLVLSLVLAIYQFGKATSLEVDLAFKEMGSLLMKSDAKVIGELATNGLYNRSSIEEFLRNNYYASDGVRTNGDTLFLSKSHLIFKKDSLISIVID